ncbi:MAG TPA: 7-carboxy-7-deazaguanine synthase QueE [Bacteroidales bacterium]|nr:7-carboxy-7-deazaguanine synthase QueE [Bacteroidales bacterium]
MDKEIFENGQKVPLVEEFYTLQGEGYHTGKAAYFIRIGGCDVGCSWCDTKFSWDPDLHPVVDIVEIVNRAAKYPASAVVVTGGEPLMVNLDPFTSLLKKEDIETFLETSGAYPLTGEWDWICLSPKKNSPPTGSIHQHADELKVIIAEDSDFEWAIEHAGLVRDDCKLFLQSEWSVSEIMLPRVIDFVKENPMWNVSLQAHKYMRIP